MKKKRNRVLKSTIFSLVFANNWGRRRSEVVGRDGMKAKSKTIRKIITGELTSAGRLYQIRI